MKAWKVEEQWGDEHACVVHADTRGKARSLGASELGYESDFIEYRATRYPLFDDRTPTPLDLIKDGWWWECAECGTMLDTESEDDDGNPVDPIGDGNDIFCDAACRDELRASQAWNRAARITREAAS